MQQYSYGQRAPYAASADSAGVNTWLRKVYGLFTAGVFTAVGGALLALNAGTPTLLSAGHGHTIAVPPAVAFGMQHGIICMIAYFGAFMAANFARRVPVLNLVALFGYTFITGLFLAPALFMAQLMGSQGATLSPAPVRDAFLLTAAAFTGLTGYVLVSKKDFSFLGAALNIGIWVILGASLLALFFHAEALHLAIASVGVLLFSGYILYDTSRLMRATDRSDPIGAALSLFLDVVNLFIMLLRILSSARSR